MSTYQRIDTWAWCEFHGVPWNLDEDASPECGEPRTLYWLDRSHIPEPILHFAPWTDEPRRTACGHQTLKGSGIAASTAEVTCQSCRNTKRFRKVTHHE